ncbi:MAG: DNA polymerase II [Halobacteriovoraceae bacterium]|nr:DNA polymerase II [Halobacteriovoraceae bacterium]
MEQNQEPIFKGFLLTAHGEDRDGRHFLHYFGRADFGPFELVFDKERPLFFVERDSQLKNVPVSFERRPLELKTFSGQAVDACYFQTQSDLYKVKDEGAARTFEADVRTTERFLMERFIKGVLEFSGDYSEENGVRVFKNPQIRTHNGEYSPTLSSLSFDIETSRGNDLYSIGIHYVDGAKEVRRVYMIGEDQGPMDEKGELFYYPTEKECYQAFEQDVHLLDPDLILGWHVVGFDMAFLERKCQRWGIKLNLGRKKSRVFISERQSGQQFARLKGRVVVDGPNALKASFFSYDSWKLDSVANEVLGVGKDIDETGLAKVAEIERRFIEDKPGLAKYNLMDCVLVTDLLEKLDLISMMQRRVELSGLLMDRQGVSTAAFDFIMLPQLHRKGFVAPNVVDIVRDVHSAGGYVLTPKTGLLHHVIVLDFKSLYPSIIRTFKIDPYSRLMAEKDPLQTPAGIKFSSTHHILPEFISELLQQRQKAKQLGNAPLSQAIKILMNSFYGVMGSAGSRFYHADLPTAITGTGQWLLRETIEYLENDGYQVVYGDTDSVFVQLPNGESPTEKGQQLARRATEHLKKVLHKHFKAESELEVEFEKYFRKIFFPILRTGEAGAKKKYVGMRSDSEGNAELQFSGMEFVRSDWTKLAKDFQYSLYERYFAGEALEEFLRETVAELKNGAFDKKLTYKKRLSKKLDEYTKSLPPHVRAAKQAQEAGFTVDRDVRYVQTRRGPMPIELEPTDFDYQHYIDKQIRPIAEVILQTLDLSFDNIVTGDQLTLF